MIVFPAIDLKDGNCVRLRQGDMAQSTVFNNDPVSQARSFEAAGFQWLHVVDLNGAISGAAVNGPAIREIVSAVRIPVQLGGGIRDIATVESWLTAGVSRVILGTAAVRDPAIVGDASRRFPGRVAVAIDARDSVVAVDGWTSDSGVPASELAQRYENVGIAAIVFTDISRDGMLQGVNVTATAALALSVTIPVIASGGVSSTDDIRRLKTSGAPIAGVVIGRALYDGRIDPAAALSAAG